MGARSRNKGARAEREVCRLFQRALGGKWSRVPLSGGWANRSEFHTCGDVITTLADFPFTIEVKCVEGWHLEQLLTAPDSCLIATWWRQACRQAAEAGKKPLLVFTRNFQPLLAMLREVDLIGAPRHGIACFTLGDDPVAVVGLESLVRTQWVA